jgi:hypothetical protein
MKNYPNIGVQIADILLPKPGIDLRKWSVIACDQFTSQSEYWNHVKEIVGDAPSTLNLILPEVYLGTQQEEFLIERTQKKMRQYLDESLLVNYEGLILVERTVGSKTRTGIMLALDLEQYNYNKGSQSLIRATEGTILERLPPRIRIREGAPLEVPHILVLIDDPEETVIEPLAAQKDGSQRLYDVDLMLNSGHLTGYWINTDQQYQQFTSALEKLADPSAFRKKYKVDEKHGVLLFAMGDGNHSLATAKAIWESIKDEAGTNHPARYALVEIENIHNKGLEFEAIHRVLFGVEEDIQQAMTAFFADRVDFTIVGSADELREIISEQDPQVHKIGITAPGKYLVAHITQPSSNLPVGTIQVFLDKWLKDGKIKSIDYVHGLDAVLHLGSQEGNLGILLPAINKSDLFKTVILDGVLPRKTFSMGEAHEKRFYMECRKIVK